MTMSGSRTAYIQPIAELAIGMTGADVERSVKDARRAARQDGGRALSFDDLQKALVEDDDRPDELRWRSCVHEAAHIVVDVIHFGPQNVFARIAKMQGRFGMSARRNDGHASGTAVEYRKRLEVILAGRTAEELICGSASHGSGGVPDSDLDKATRLACAMVGSLGLAGPTPFTYLGPARDAGTLLAFAEIRAAVHQELSEAARSCALLLKENRSALAAVARRLAAQGRIDGVQVAALLAERGRDSRLSKQQGAKQPREAVRAHSE
jgi:cell division protease FtsH